MEEGKGKRKGGSKIGKKEGWKAVTGKGRKERKVGWKVSKKKRKAEPIGSLPVFEFYVFEPDSHDFGRLLGLSGF